MSLESLGQALEKEYDAILRSGLGDSRQARTGFYFEMLERVDPTGYTDPWIKKTTIESLEILCEEHGEEAAARLIKDAATRALGREA